MNNTVEVTEVWKRYASASTYALKGVSATFPEGRVIGLLGHNGAGKSTLIKLIIGLIRASAGHIGVFGVSPSGPNARTVRRRLAYLPENVTFYGNLTGREVIGYLAGLKQASPEQGLSLMERVGLTDAMGWRVGMYSKGMRQRLGLAQALLGAPGLLLLDEPTTGLDPIATRDFYRILGELRAEGRTVIVSSHLLAELEPHLDQAVILGHGKVLAYGTLDQMRARADLPVTMSIRSSRPIGALLRESWRRELGVVLGAEHDLWTVLEVPPKHKMEVGRALMERQEVTDIDMKEATLETLYAQLSTQREADAQE